MFQVPSSKFQERGFTFIEVLIGVALLVIIMIALYGVLQLGLKVAAQSKARITATALANQKIEMVRNLPYNQVGTMAGIPPGNIPQIETITRNNIDYTVRTTVGYVDDPFDGLAPEDSLPNDYKKIKVKVSWAGFLGGQVILITDISPKGLETTEGGGNLLISVFDAWGEPIVQADIIHIINNNLDPPIDVFYQTNDQGQYLVAGAPSSTNAYQIIVTQSGYTIDRTYGPEEVANPDKPHATVLEGKLTEISFSIDRLSSFSVSTLAWTGEGPIPLGYVSFNLQGNKIIGTDADENPVAKYSADLTTDSNGYLNIPDLAWDAYDFTIDPAENLDLASTTPISELVGQEIELLPNTNQSISLFLEAENSCLVNLVNDLTLEPIFSAQVRLANLGLGYDQTQFTDEQGRTLFIPLEAGTYNIEIQRDGYESYSGTVEVAGDTIIYIHLMPTEPS